MFAFFRAFRIPLPYVILGAPLGRLLFTHEESIFLGRREKSIRATCPAHLSWRSETYESIDEIPVRSMMSAFEIECLRVCVGMGV